MPAGRPRKPTALHKLEGTIPMHPRGREPAASGKPVKPRGMSATARKMWDFAVPKLIRLGVAKEIDAPALEQLCRWWGILRELQEIKPEERNKQWVFQVSNADKAWRYYAGKFGMTPAERAQLEVGAKEDLDPAAEFIA